MKFLCYFPLNMLLEALFMNLKGKNTAKETQDMLEEILLWWQLKALLQFF